MATTAALWASGTPTTSGTTWTNVGNAVGANNGTFATRTTSTNGAVGWIQLAGYGAQAAVGATPASVDSVSVTVYGYVSNTGRWSSMQVGLFAGATQVGTTQAMTLSTSTTNSQTFTFTGVTWADLADLRVRVTGTKSGSISATLNVDAARIMVTYTPTGGGGGGDFVDIMVDDFSGDLAQWGWSYGNVVLDAGRARLEFTAGYSGLYPQTARSFHERVFVAEVEVPSGTWPTTREFYIEVLADADNKVTFVIVGGTTLSMRRHEAAVLTQSEVPYDRVAMRWLRLRETGGALYWETSPDGQTWTLQYALGRTMNLTAVYPTVTAGDYGTSPPAGVYAYVHHIGTPAQTGGTPAALTTTAGVADATGGAAVATGAARLTTAAADAAAVGESAVFAAGASGRLATIAGHAAADGGTSTIRTTATLAVGPGEATATGASAVLGGDPAPALPGIGAWYVPGVEAMLTDTGASWYYTWEPHHNWFTKPAGMEFVPMIRGPEDVTAANLAEVARHGPILLGFNEPDEAWQTNMTPAQALNLWPQLEGTGQRLGAPAVAKHGATPGSWLDTFMSGAITQRRRVDFVPLHYYPPENVMAAGDIPAAAVADLRTYLEAVHARYGKTIWLTEFALVGWTATLENNVVPPPAVQAAFLTAAVTMMNSLPFVERWAWFSLTEYSYSPGVETHRADGTRTAIGQSFAAITATKFPTTPADANAGAGPALFRGAARLAAVTGSAAGSGTAVGLRGATKFTAETGPASATGGTAQPTGGAALHSSPGSAVGAGGNAGLAGGIRLATNPGQGITQGGAATLSGAGVYPSSAATAIAGGGAATLGGGATGTFTTTAGPASAAGGTAGLAGSHTATLITAPGGSTGAGTSAGLHGHATLPASTGAASATGSGIAAAGQARIPTATATATAGAGTIALSGGAPSTIPTTPATATATGTNAALSGTARFTVTAGQAAADSGTAILRAPVSVTPTPGQATAHGAAATLAAAARFTAAAGTADAKGGSVTTGGGHPGLFFTSPGPAPSTGGLVNLAGAAVFTHHAGTATATGTTVIFDAATRIVFVTGPGTAHAAGSVGFTAGARWGTAPGDATAFGSIIVWKRAEPHPDRTNTIPTDRRTLTVAAETRRQEIRP